MSHRVTVKGNLVHYVTESHELWSHMFNEIMTAEPLRDIAVTKGIP